MILRDRRSGNKKQVILLLRQINTETGNRLADELEKEPGG